MQTMCENVMPCIVKIKNSYSLDLLTLPCKIKNIDLLTLLYFIRDLYIVM
nr:MAG TPA: hypothetical protein [Caudoviricetes sp.]